MGKEVAQVQERVAESPGPPAAAEWPPCFKEAARRLILWTAERLAQQEALAQAAASRQDGGGATGQTAG